MKTDLFTFWQRYPDIEPRFSYHQEWGNWAVLPISSYHDWFHHQISSKIRAKIRKAAKMGVETKIVPLSEEYIANVTRIFNESQIRQGKKFAHYGRAFEDVASELRTEEARTDFIGAYYQGEMIGFIQQVYVKDGAYPFGGISSVAHRDKASRNAMLSKAGEACADRGGRYLIYGHFDYGTGGGCLAEFKAQNGFRKALLPRYYVALNPKGALGLALHLHHGFKGMVPKRLLHEMVTARKKWRARRISGLEPPPMNGPPHVLITSRASGKPPGQQRRRGFRGLSGRA